MWCIHRKGIFQLQVLNLSLIHFLCMVYDNGTIIYFAVYPLDKTDMFPSPYKQATHRRRSLSVSPAEDSGDLYHLLPSSGGIRKLWLLSPHSVLCQEGGPLASIRMLSPHGIGLFPTHQSSKTGAG